MNRITPYRALSAVLALLLVCTVSFASDRDKKLRAQRDTTLFPNSYLDTVKVNNVFVLNDYMLVGFDAGAGFNRMLFNPAYSQTWRFNPEYYEFSITRYGKLFGYMPYFGIKLGVAYGHEGFKMKYNEVTGYISTLDSATECVYDVLEVPVYAHFHYDTPHFKIMMDLGPYAGKRMNIHRTGDYVSEEFENDFNSHDKRFDYGLKGGVGFGIVLDPVEFHINAKVRYSWSNIVQPDFRSPYYYTFAYPLDLMVTAGAYFQLSKKTGKNKATLRKEAREIVFGTEE